MAGPARRDPWPADIKFNGEYYMLARDKSGKLLVSSRAPVLEAAPTTYEYGSQNPMIEWAQDYTDMTLGYGLAVQQGRNDRRYHFADGLDLSVGGVWLKGPAIQTGIVPSSTGEIRRFFEINSTLCALAGRYLIYRSGDGATGWNNVGQDLGAGNAATDVLVFQHSGGTKYAYVGIGDGAADYIWRSADGVTWTQHASLQALYFARTGRQLFRAHATNKVSVCDVDADPWTAANWNDSYEIGDDSSAITGLAVHSTGQLIVFKTDGIYSLAPDGTDIRYFPFLQFATDTDNGRYWGQFENDLYVSYRDGFFRLTPDLTLEPIGPDRLIENASAIKGQITAFAGHGTFNGYAGLWNPDTSKAYLMKFGSWLTSETSGGELTLTKRLAAWHGSISVTGNFSSSGSESKITALHTTTIGAATGHSRMYIATANGAIWWFKLPCTANPLACSEYGFTINDGYVQLPYFTGGFAADQKALRAVTVISRKYPSGDTIGFEYSTTVTGAPAHTQFTNFSTVPIQRQSFPSGTTSGMASFRVRINNTGATTQPEMAGLAVHSAVRADAFMQHDLPILAEDNLVKRDGTRMRLDASAIRSAVLTPVTGAGDYTLILPDERTVQVAVVNFGERTSFGFDQSGRWRKALLLTVCELAEVA